MPSGSGRRRALLSVFDKSGIVDFAKGLVELDWELISSGGTAAVLGAASVPVTDVADYTGSPIMLGHRVATLHPRIHGGILADRNDPQHQADLTTHNIDVIDLVVGNLYPFRSKPGVEMIDIGGPALLRAAAKNHAYVGVATSPTDYDLILAELRDNHPDTALSTATRWRLARAAFAHTAAYDAAIVDWFDSNHQQPESSEDKALPATVHLALERAETLRYGENPHQKAARYRLMGETSVWDQVEQYSGTALSYLNLVDVDAAWRLAHEIGGLGELDDRAGRCAVAIIKHANPCGAAVANNLASAYQRAFDCDPRSAFGGIVALNRIVDEATVEAMESAAQADVVIAPDYADGVVERLIAKRSNTRILRAEAPVSSVLASGSGSVVARTSLRQISDGFLLQQPQCFGSEPASWQTVTKRQPAATELSDAVFAWRVCAHVKSNAVVLAHNGVAWGIGAGQQNRVEASAIAANKAAGRAEGGACASDAFYPFADGIHAAADADVAIIVQPGGSVNDDQTIAAADERGVAMVFTGERQFLH